MKNLFKKIGLVAICISVFSCSDNDNNTSPKTILEIAEENPEFSILVDDLERTGLDAVLDGSGSFTVFVPTNDAFQAFLPVGASVADVPVDVLEKILLNHFIGVEIKSMDIETGYASTLSSINTSANAQTNSMFILKEGSTVILNGGSANSGATVIAADIDASNGVVQAVGNVIAIPTLVNHVVANPLFNTLQSIVTSLAQSAILSALNGITAAAPATLFAPNNAAFTAATTRTGFAVGATATQVTKVLQYHVTTAGNVRSNQLTNNQVIPMITSPVQNTTAIIATGTVDIKDTQNILSRVFQADIQASNGVIHGVNKVLRPF